MKKPSMFRRIAIISAASFGIAALGSSAQAQPDPCHQYAWYTCSYDEQGRPIQVTYECYSYHYDLCSGGGGLAALDAYTRPAALAALARD